MTNTTADDGLRHPRLQIFVDFWNLQLTLNERVHESTGEVDPRFQIDWLRLPAVACTAAMRLIGTPEYQYEGTNIYASYDMRSSDGGRFQNWLHTWLDRQPGIQVFARERRVRRAPDCPACHRQVENCPHCGGRMRGSIEKGVDTALVTDMIRLAWEDAYDIGIVVSLDADLVPAVEFLGLRGRKIIQAGFPPKGLDLATSCWGSFDLFPLREQFRRP